MASGPITSWPMYGGKNETVADFIFCGSKITGDGDCSHEIKRCLFIVWKAMTNLDSVLKRRDITLLTNIHMVKAVVLPGRSPGEGHSNPLQYSCLENPMDRGAWQAAVHRVAKSWTQMKRLRTHIIFPVVMYICESCTIKKAKCQRIDAFEL